MVLVFGGCEDTYELSPQVPDGAVADAAVIVDAAAPDSSAGDAAAPDGAISDSSAADALMADAQNIDTAPLPEITLLKAELSKIVAKPGHGWQAWRFLPSTTAR